MHLPHTRLTSPRLRTGHFAFDRIPPQVRRLTCSAANVVIPDAPGFNPGGADPALAPKALGRDDDRKVVQGSNAIALPQAGRSDACGTAVRPFQRGVLYRDA